jgi:hypothetical protein
MDHVLKSASRVGNDADFNRGGESKCIDDSDERLRQHRSASVDLILPHSLTLYGTSSQMSSSLGSSYAGTSPLGVERHARRPSSPPASTAQICMLADEAARAKPLQMPPPLARPMLVGTQAERNQRSTEGTRSFEPIALDVPSKTQPGKATIFEALPRPVDTFSPAPLVHVDACGRDMAVSPLPEVHMVDLRNRRGEGRGLAEELDDNLPVRNVTVRRRQRSQSHDTSFIVSTEKDKLSPEKYRLVPLRRIQSSTSLGPQKSRDDAARGTEEESNDSERCWNMAGSPASALTSDESIYARERNLGSMPCATVHTVNDTTHRTVSTKMGVFLAPVQHHQHWDPHHGMDTGNAGWTAPESTSEDQGPSVRLSNPLSALPHLMSARDQRLKQQPQPPRPLSPPPSLWVPVLLPDPIPAYRIADSAPSYTRVAVGSPPEVATGCEARAPNVSLQVIDHRPDGRFYFAVTPQNVANCSPVAWKRALEIIGAPVGRLRSPPLALQYLQRYFQAVRDPHHYIYIESRLCEVPAEASNPML